VPGLTRCTYILGLGHLWNGILLAVTGRGKGQRKFILTPVQITKAYGEYSHVSSHAYRLH
jgi:FKBP-type peptidyl-prolyl cis-trans isomerase 2